MKNMFSPLAKIILFEKSALKFGLGVIAGMAFSISVILCTIGIMDGFEKTVREGLRKTMGDIYFYSRNGFFSEEDYSAAIKKMGVKVISPHVQSEAFLIFNETSKGVLVKGVNQDSFSKLTGLELTISDSGIVIGSELAKSLDISVGQEVVLALAGGNRDFSGLPLLKRFKVSGVITHGIYQKDMRLIYMDKEQLQTSLRIKGRVNVVGINIPEESLSNPIIEEITQFKDFQYRLEEELGIDFLVKPFWNDFSTLFEAVKAEKSMITLILQLIVIISIFNVLAFVTFLNEKRSKEIFLFKALGMSQKRLVKMWRGIILLGWLLSCILSIGLVKIFGYALTHLSFFQLPGDIYYLGRLTIHLDWKNYLLVFGLALVWIFIISLVTLWKLRKKSILHGLRREFS